MPDYKLIMNDDGAIILDQNGERVDLDAARSVLEVLQDTYEPSACVYLLHRTTDELYKIGMTTQDIGNRLSQIRYVEKSRSIELIHTILCNNLTQAVDLEFILHSIYDNCRERGEWFQLSLFDVEQFKGVNIGIRALAQVISLWQRIIEESDNPVYSLREEAIYQRCRAQIDQWHERCREHYQHKVVLTARLKALNDEKQACLREARELKKDEKQLFGREYRPLQ